MTRVGLSLSTSARSSDQQSPSFGRPFTGATSAHHFVTPKLGDCWSLDLAEVRSEEHTSELQPRPHLVCRLLLANKREAAVDRCSECHASPGAASSPPGQHNPEPGIGSQSLNF